MMSNWYIKTIKTANALAQSLGISGDSFLFKEIQRFEKELKRKGDWMSILKTKKTKGQDVAIKKLRNTINGYQLDTEKNPIEVPSHKVTHLKRTATGGDWYEFDNSYLDGIKEEDFEDWASNHEEYIESSYIEWLGDSAEIQTHLELHYEGVMSRLDMNMKNYLGMSQSKEERSGQERMPFYESPQLIRIKRRYERLKKEEEDRLADAIKDAESASSVDDLVYVYEEYMGEDLAEDYVSEIKNGIHRHAEMLWESEEAYRESQQEEKLKEQMSDYFKLTCGAGWCISQPGDHLEEYLKEGYSFLVLRRNKEARMAIRFEGSDIEEVQGISNDLDNISDLDILDLLECPKFNTEQIMDGLHHGQYTVDDDQRAEHFMEQLINMDNDVAQLESIQSVFNNKSKELVSLFNDSGESPIENIKFILLRLSEYDTSENDLAYNILKEKLFSFFGEMITSGSPLQKNSNNTAFYTWGHAIVEMLTDETEIETELIKELFGKYPNEILPEFFDSVTKNENTEHKLWVEKIALNYLYTVFGKPVIDYATRYGLTRNDATFSKQETIEYISKRLFDTYGIEKFRNNPEAIKYVVNTVLESANDNSYYIAVVNLFEFIKMANANLLSEYSILIAKKVVDLAIRSAEKVYPNDLTNQRHDVLNRLLINSSNPNSSHFLPMGLVNAIHNEPRVSHLKEMRKRLDFNNSQDPANQFIYPNSGSSTLPPDYDSFSDLYKLSNTSNSWYKKGIK